MDQDTANLIARVNSVAVSVEDLVAMAALITSGKLPQGLVPETSDGGRMVAEPIFVAAAKEPILFTEKEPFFNAESFIESVHRHSGVDGHA